jgi:hypothetical protein
MASLTWSCVHNPWCLSLIFLHVRCLIKHFYMRSHPASCVREIIQCFVGQRAYVLSNQPTQPRVCKHVFRISLDGPIIPWEQASLFSRQSKNNENSWIREFWKLILDQTWESVARRCFTHHYISTSSSFLFIIEHITKKTDSPRFCIVCNVKLIRRRSPWMTLNGCHFLQNRMVWWTSSSSTSFF